MVEIEWLVGLPKKITAIIDSKISLPSLRKNNQFMHDEKEWRRDMWDYYINRYSKIKCSNNLDHSQIE